MTSEHHPHGTMRRHDREITDRAGIDAILHANAVLHLGLCDNNTPFVVPLFYAYDGKFLYLHSAQAGTKIEIMKRNPSVCFEVTMDHEIIEAENACSVGAKHRTVIGFGRAVFVDDPDEKIRALDLLMARFSKRTFTYPEESLARTAVIRIEIEAIKGKQNGY